MKNLVFVDDDNITNLLMQRMLKHSSFVVHTFTKTTDAQAFITSNEVDILIVDLRMPVMNGIDFLKQLDLPSRTHRINRVIIQTGLEPEKSVRDELISLGYELIIKDQLLGSREQLTALLG